MFRARVTGTERDKELRTYRVTRIHSVRLLDKSFSRRPDFDLPTYWRAQAQSAQVDIVASADHVVTVRVADDGKGFDTSRTPANHFGVNIMNDRQRLKEILLEKVPWLFDHQYWGQYVH